MAVTPSAGLARPGGHAGSSQGWLVGAGCGEEVPGPLRRGPGGDVAPSPPKIEQGRRSRVLLTLVPEVTHTITKATVLPVTRFGPIQHDREQEAQEWSVTGGHGGAWLSTQMMPLELTVQGRTEDKKVPVN